MPLTTAPPLLTACIVVIVQVSLAVASDPVVPGTGTQIVKVGDDFEDPDWAYDFRGQKSSTEMDNKLRGPAGESANKRWYEGVKRGHPDVIRRIETPKGGLEGSTGALLLQSLRTGIPGRTTNRTQQDDLIADVSYRLGGMIPVSQSPSVVTRVFLPPIDTWENRSGAQFGFRASIETMRRGKWETYWPGLIITFESKDNSENRKHDYAYFRVRGDRNGRDFKGKQITTTGWWTLGLSFTPDGQVHYFAKPGLDDLTADDHITSQLPYGFKCQRFKTFFYNVCNLDNGRTWSTSWVVDDPQVFFIPTKTASKGSLKSR